MAFTPLNSKEDITKLLVFIIKRFHNKCAFIKKEGKRFRNNASTRETDAFREDLLLGKTTKHLSVMKILIHHQKSTPDSKRGENGLHDERKC